MGENGKISVDHTYSEGGEEERSGTSQARGIPSVSEEGTVLTFSSQYSQ